MNPEPYLLKFRFFGTLGPTHPLLLPPVRSPRPSAIMPRVRMLASGNEICSCFAGEEKIAGLSLASHPVRELKRHLQGHCRRPRFQKKLLCPDGAILDDGAAVDTFDELQLVLLSWISGGEGANKLVSAAENGDAMQLEVLLNAPQDPDERNESGAPALCAAAASGHEECALLLLEARADVDLERTRDRATPLFCAAAAGHLALVRLLRDAGAGTNEVNLEGATPLYAAAQGGHAAVVDFLLDIKS